MLNPTQIKWMWVQNDIALTKLTNMHATIQAKDEPPFLTYRPQPSYTLLHAHTRTSTLRIGKKPLVLSWFSFSTCLHTRSYTRVAPCVYEDGPCVYEGGRFNNSVPDFIVSTLFARINVFCNGLYDVLHFSCEIIWHHDK